MLSPVAPISNWFYAAKISRAATSDSDRLIDSWRLVAESDDCEKVMQQMSAARKAMDKAFYEMLACVIEHEVVQDPEAASAPESMARVKSLLSRYS